MVKGELYFVLNYTMKLEELKQHGPAPKGSLLIEQAEDTSEFAEEKH